MHLSGGKAGVGFFSTDPPKRRAVSSDEMGRIFPSRTAFFNTDALVRQVRLKFQTLECAPDCILTKLKVMQVSPKKYFFVSGGCVGLP